MAAAGGKDPSQRRVRVVFRMDDVSERSDTAFERRLFEVFRRHRVPLVLGIIPNVCEGDFADPGPQRGLSLGEEKAGFLRRQLARGPLLAALHGFSHQTNPAAAERRRVAELAGADREQQRRKLESGKETLERALGTDVNVFIPPWNQYDEVTLEQLQASGFRTLCAGENFGPAPAGLDLELLPATTDLFHFEEAVEAAAASRDGCPIVVALFHGYDFLDHSREQVMSLEALDDLLAAARRRDEIQLTALDALGRSGADLSAERYRKNLAVWQLRHLTPRSWRGRLKSRYYRSTVNAARHLRRARVMLSVFYASLLTLSALGSSALFAALAAADVRAAWVLSLTGALVLARTVAVTLRRRRLEARPAILGSLAVGLLLGAWLA